MRHAPIRSYKDLKVWQRAIHLLVQVSGVLRVVPVPERYDFASQMRRAALSVSSNIAEGFGRDHLGDYLRNLACSRGSAFEVESDLIALGALELVPNDELAPVIESADAIGRMLASQSRKLRAHRRARPAHNTFFDAS
jgi:four helix bundle protein